MKNVNKIFIFNFYGTTFFFIYFASSRYTSPVFLQVSSNFLLQLSYDLVFLLGNHFYFCGIPICVSTPCSNSSVDNQLLSLRTPDVRVGFGKLFPRQPALCAGHRQHCVHYSKRGIGLHLSLWKQTQTHPQHKVKKWVEHPSTVNFIHIFQWSCFMYNSKVASI